MTIINSVRNSVGDNYSRNIDFLALLTFVVEGAYSYAISTDKSDFHKDLLHSSGFDRQTCYSNGRRNDDDGSSVGLMLCHIASKGDGLASGFAVSAD